MRKASEQNSLGEPIDTWSVFKTVAASKRDVKGSETIAAGEERAGGTHTEFRIRASSSWAPDTSDRIEYKGLAYDIKSVQEIERGRGYVLIAVARSD